MLETIVLSGGPSAIAAERPTPIDTPDVGFTLNTGSRNRISLPTSGSWRGPRWTPRTSRMSRSSVADAGGAATRDGGSAARAAATGPAVAPASAAATSIGNACLGERMRAPADRVGPLAHTPPGGVGEWDLGPPLRSTRARHSDLGPMALAARPGILPESPGRSPQCWRARDDGGTTMLTRIAVALALLLGVAHASPPQREVSASRVERLTAIVQKIDVQTREMTLKGEDGAETTFKVAKDVRNLDKVKVGDEVSVTFDQALTLWILGADEAGPQLSVGTDVYRAAPGEKPSGLMTADVTGVATVEQIAADK